MPKKFTSDYQPKAEAKRKLKTKTLVKEALEKRAMTFEDLQKNSIEKWLWLRENAKTFQEKYLVEKELSKYFYPQKRQFEGKFDGNININFTY